MCVEIRTHDAHGILLLILIPILILIAHIVALQRCSGPQLQESNPPQRSLQANALPTDLLKPVFLKLVTIWREEAPSAISEPLARFLRKH